MGNFRDLALWTALACLGGSACAPAPHADSVRATVPQRGVVTVVVVPDLGPPGDLEVVSVSQPAHGLAQTGARGSVVYAPSTTFTGEDSFTYTLRNRAGRMATGGVTVTVVPVNEPPEPRHDLFTITWVEALAGARLEVLWNDLDLDRDPLRVVGVTDGDRGSVTIADDGGAVTYRAWARFRDVDTFDYTVSDGEHEVTTWVVVQVTEP